MSEWDGEHWDLIMDHFREVNRKMEERMNEDLYGDNTEKSGGTRYSAGKPSMWWAMPLAGLRLIAMVTAYGSRKYAPFDWAEGQSYSTLLDSMSRHWEAVMTYGVYARDEESGLYHLAHMGWNLLCLLHFIATHRHDLDDVTRWRGVRTGEEPMSDEEVLAEDLLGTSRRD